MIAFLRGQLAAVAGDEVWIDVGGVGFRVAVSRQTQRRLPAVGEPVRLLTRLVVREEQWALYGFATADEQAAFDALLAVSGVGPRVALAVLSVLTPEELRRAVVLQDPAPLTRASGVGPKLARRMVMELRDRLGEPLAEAAGGGALPGGEPAGGAGAGALGGEASPRADAMAALEALGYTRAEAEGALAAAAAEVEPDAPAAAWVRAALRVLGGARAAGGAGR